MLPQTPDYDSQTSSTPYPGSTDPGRPSLAMDGRGGVFFPGILLVLQLILGLILAPVIFVVGAVLASSALDR